MTGKRVRRLRWKELDELTLFHNLAAGDCFADRITLICARCIVEGATPARARSLFRLSFTTLMERTASQLGGCSAPFTTNQTRRPVLRGNGHFGRVERTLAAT